MAGCRHEDGCYKPLPPSIVLKSETLIKEVIKKFEEEVINPFSVNTDNTKLFVLSSGVPVADDVVVSMLPIKKKGERLAKTFQSERIHNKVTPLNAPIKRLKITLKASLH